MAKVIPSKQRYMFITNDNINSKNDTLHLFKELKCHEEEIHGKDKSNIHNLNLGRRKYIVVVLLLKLSFTTLS